MAIPVFVFLGGIPKLLLPDAYPVSANAVAARGYAHANSRQLI
jgi:hypothetical protein